MSFTRDEIVSGGGYGFDQGSHSYMLNGEDMADFIEAIMVAVGKLRDSSGLQLMESVKDKDAMIEVALDAISNAVDL